MTSSPQKILIIEDEAPLARALDIKLSKNGYEVIAASDGQEALPLLEQHAFAVIICDLVMPRMGGKELLEYMQAKNNATPVIVLSNLSQQEDKEECLKLGAQEFLVKSDTSIDTLVSHIEAILN